MVAIARPASTVVLMDSESRVYLTKRPSTMKFLGDYYVFPGGAVDDSDYEFQLPSDTAEKHIETEDFAYYIAAARELFEEVGIFMTNESFTLQQEKQLTYRKQLVNGEITLNEMVNKENLSLDFRSLTEFAHFTTPKYSPIRFCTRFFIAQLPPNQKPIPDTYEVADATWLTPEESLEAGKRGEILLSHPTREVLKKVIALQS